VFFPIKIAGYFQNIRRDQSDFVPGYIQTPLRCLLEAPAVRRDCRIVVGSYLVNLTLSLIATKVSPFLSVNISLKLNSFSVDGGSVILIWSMSFLMLS
jgi:hypothetical protein